MASMSQCKKLYLLAVIISVLSLPILLYLSWFSHNSILTPSSTPYPSGSVLEHDITHPTEPVLEHDIARSTEPVVEVLDITHSTEPVLEHDITHSTEPVVEHDISHPTVDRGYTLAVDFYEQQAGGVANLQNLQCWAGLINVTVVEPFVIESRPQFPVFMNRSGQLRFSDLFDLQYWQEKNSKMNYSNLVPWEDFIEHAPRDVILVQIREDISPNWDWDLEEKVAKDPSKYPQPPERYISGCREDGWEKESTYAFLRAKHFKVIREVCFNFEYNDKLTLQQFNSHIFGEYLAGETTVIFNRWRGTDPTYRIKIKDIPCCPRGSLIHCDTILHTYIRPSHQLSHKAEQYHKKYLNSGKFIAVNVRMGKLMTIRARSTPDKIIEIMQYCLQQTLKYHDAMSKDTGINTTFLAIDIGKYGCQELQADRITEIWRVGLHVQNLNRSNEKIYENVQSGFVNFFRWLYGDSLSLTQWEKTLEDTSHTTDSGYIALLQQTIATLADCNIFVGGGKFQRHGLWLYKKNHPGEKECLKIIRNCTVFTIGFG